MNKNNRVVLIIPCYNEEQKLEKTLTRLQLIQESIHEVVVIDDASSDASVQVARKMKATVISIPENQSIGVGAALQVGFEYALDHQFDIVVVMAANNKDDPKEIPDLLRPITENKADFVQGSRFLGAKNFGDMPLYRRLATRLHAVLFSWLIGKHLTETTNGFRAFRSQILNDERILWRQDWLVSYELEPYLYYKVIQLRYTTCEVACTKVYPPRSEGYTKMPAITGWWSMLKPLILLKLKLRS